jgi:hypothetical protein
MRTFTWLAFCRRKFHDLYTRLTAGLIGFQRLRDALQTRPALAP